MRSSTLLFALLNLTVLSPLSAQSISYEDVEVGADRFAEGGERNIAPGPGNRANPPLGLSGGFASSSLVPPAPVPEGVARYGPFRLLDESRVALVDVTDSRSPAQFAALLRDHPGVGTVELIDCPGTEDDLANLRLGRMIRERGLATYVPAGGSVRSGAVELFLAGARRQADPGAEFAVHAWQDDTGLEPGDYAAAATENRRYIDYYRQMGMSPLEAEAFYAMTNSVPFESARWFGTGVMGLWIDLDGDSPSNSADLYPEQVRVLDSVPTLQ